MVNSYKGFSSIILTLIVLFIAIIAFLLYTFGTKYSSFNKEPNEIVQLEKEKVIDESIKLENSDNNINVEEISGEIRVVPEFEEGDLIVHQIVFESLNSEHGPCTTTAALVDASPTLLTYRFNMKLPPFCGIKTGENIKVKVYFRLVGDNTNLVINVPEGGRIEKEFIFTNSIEQNVDIEVLVK